MAQLRPYWHSILRFGFGFGSGGALLLAKSHLGSGGRLEGSSQNLGATAVGRGADRAHCYPQPYTQHPQIRTKEGFIRAIRILVGPGFACKVYGWG